MKIILALFVLCFTAPSVLSHSEHGHHQAKMHDAKMSQDMEHVMEHLKDKVDLQRDISTEELEFYYFL